MFKLPESLALDEQSKACPNKLYQRLNTTLLPLCKPHFIKFMRNFLRKQLFDIYRHSDNAFGAMDMSGKGYINTNDFQNAVAMKRIIDNFNNTAKAYKISREDIGLFLVNSNYFTTKVNPKTGAKELTIEYKSFKRAFFPHLCHANDKDVPAEFASDLVASVE